MTMTEGMVARWVVPDGDQVQKGELLYHLETEKVEMEVDADASGTVKHWIGEGVTVEPGAVIGYIYGADEEIPDVLPAPSGELAPIPASAGPAAAQAVSEAPAPTRGEGGRLASSPAARRLARELGVDIGSVSGTGPAGRIVESDVRARHEAGPAPSETPAPRAPASPVARRVAKQLGVDLARVRGTGPGGRITKDDVEAAVAAPKAAPAAAAVAGSRAAQTIPVRGMRKVIAQRMAESLHSTAQLTMEMDVRMDDAVRLREQLIDEWQPEGVRPTYTDLVIRAASKALRQHPLMNSVFSDTEITLVEEVNVGMAVALDDGLVVPVIQHADALSLKEIAIEATRLSRLARAGNLGIDDMHGGTFTVSTLGMFGVDSFTPIINAPESGILGVNRIVDGVGWEGDRPVRRRTMRLSLTWDHRALDGAPAARFLASVRDLLEAPYRLLL
jgi:pyruvate dehydrogenase E2 component (dihydrolipoamide acetyltransferase)